MAATASLSVLLQAVTSDFDKKMNKSTKNVSKMKSSVDSASSGYANFDRAVKAAAARTARMNSIVSKASKALKAFGIVAAAGAAAAIVAMTKSAFTSIDVLDKYAQRLGIATEELQKLQFAAKVTAGVTESTLNMALQRMTRRVSEAVQGTGEAVNAIKELGLNIQVLGGLSPDKQFRLIADAMSRIPNQADRVRLSFKLFDSEGVALVNTLTLGSEGLDELGRKLESTGGLLTQEMTTKVALANDELSLLAETTKAIGVRLAVDLAPSLQFAVQEFNNLAISMNGVSAASGGLSALTSVLLVFLEVIRFVRFTVGLVVIAFDLLVVALSVVGGIILKLISGFGLFSTTINDLADEFFFFAAGAADDVGDVSDALEELANADSSFTRLENFQKRQREELKKTQIEAKAAAEAASANAKNQINSVADVGKKAAEGIKKVAKVPVDKIGEQLKRLSQVIIDRNLTPLEEFRRGVMALQQVFARGLLSDEFFERELSRLREVFAEATRKIVDPIMAAVESRTGGTNVGVFRSPLAFQTNREAKKRLTELTRIRRSSERTNQLLSGNRPVEVSF